MRGQYTQVMNEQMWGPSVPPRTSLRRARAAPPAAHAARTAVAVAAADTGIGRPRKPRSRSSPVRTGSVSPDGRARSPSVSPPRAPRPAAPRATRYPPPCPALAALEHRHYLLKQRSDLSHRSAYFSLRPPASPMKLTSAGVSTPPEPAPLTPGTAAVPPPPAPGALRGPRADLLRAVRHLLADLVSALPLPPCLADHQPGQPSSYNSYSYSRKQWPDKTSLPPMSHCSRSLLSQPKAGKLHLAAPKTAVGTTSPAPLNLDYRSVAVQALDHRRNTEEECMNDSYDNSQKEGWVGGVRALRDSHVRLVLRQLRHIERLNRALDRAARPLPPPQ